MQTKRKNITIIVGGGGGRGSGVGGRAFLAGLILLMGFAQIGVAQTVAGQTEGKGAGKTKGPAHLHIRVLAKAYEDSIVVRWAPEDAVAWIMGKDSGYRITRIDYSDPARPVRKILTVAPFKPLTLEQMKASLDRDNKYAAIAAQALYGNDFRMTKNQPKGFAKQIKQGHDAMNFRYSFAMQAADFSPPVASALALRWVDKDVKKGEKYIYVIMVNGGNKNYVVDSAAAYIADIKTGSDPSPEGLKAYGFDRQVELHWNRRQMGNFSAYFVERSGDGGKTFQSLTKLPYYAPDQPPPNVKKDTSLRKAASLLRDHQIYFDSIPQDYKDYTYRVRGINAFAELSPYSAPVTVQGRDLTAPVAPVIESATNTEGSEIKLSWSQRTASPDLAGYYISRGNAVKGPFYPMTKTLLPKNTRSFVDSAAVPHLPNYYVVIAVDTARNLSASPAYPGYLTDTTAPAAPLAVTGTVDSFGVVQLAWAAGKEADLKGYKVYFGYSPSDEFSQVTKELLTDNRFIDTISMKSLNRSVYYKVVAVDKSNNHSAYSLPAAVKKTVVVPPSAPVAGTVAVKRKSVAIEWIESRSEGAAGYEIFRKGGGKDWASVARLKQDWKTSSLHYTDTAIAANTDYYYTAQTIDSTGVRSERSFAVHARANVQDSLPALGSLQAKWDARTHHVALSWQYKDTGDYFFVVYRSVGGGSLDAWHSYEKATLAGVDDEVKSGAYAYAIRVVHRDKNTGSRIGKPVRVNVN
jgi:fibronectin type 3 domain-containing protein